METNVRKLSSVCVLRFVTLNNRDTRQEEVDLSGLGTPPGQNRWLQSSTMQQGCRINHLLVTLPYLLAPTSRLPFNLANLLVILQLFLPPSAAKGSQVPREASTRDKNVFLVVRPTYWDRLGSTGYFTTSLK